MAYTDAVKIDSGFKNLMGFEFSELEKNYFEEASYSIPNLSASDVWTQTDLIEFNNPSAALANGVVYYFDRFVLTPDDDTYFEGQYRAWKLHDPPGSEENTRHTGFVHHARFGPNYIFQLFDNNDTLIGLDQQVEYGIVFNYFNGTLFMNDDAWNDAWATPFKISVYKYIGQTAADLGTVTPSGVNVAGDSIKKKYTCDGSISAHRVIIIKEDDKISYANHSPSTSTFKKGLSLQAGVNGEEIEVLIFGQIDKVGWAWTNYQPVFFDDLGQLTQSPSSSGYIQEVAQVEDGNTIFFNPQIAILR